MMTPYGRKSGEEFAGQVTKQGYAFVCQDFRGRFDSEGEDYPVFVHCGWGEQGTPIAKNRDWEPHQDGYDTVEWIARQAWSNGKVGGYGVSASGIALNMTAPSRPPHLTCCYISVAFSNMYSHAAYQGGAFRKGLLDEWLGGNPVSPKNLH